MNRIDRNNYEAYFLDYHEGSLDSKGKLMVEAFLRDNPDLYDDFRDFDNIILPVPDIKYPGKSELFRTAVSIPEVNEWEYLCIASMEGDLNESESSEFEAERKADPEKAKTFEMYLSTRSFPDESIQYRDRASLKKKAVLIPRWMYGAVSAAAAIILGWIIFMPVNERSPQDPLASDTSREIIYIDKISHPSKFEKLASTETGPALKSKTSVVMPEDPVIAEATPEREIIVMASLANLQPGRIELPGSEPPLSSTLFAYRYIPDAQDSEYQTFLAFSGEMIRKQILGQDPEIVKNSRFSLWELADAGLQKISDLFGTNADIEREYSESGKLVAVTFESTLVGFYTPVGKRPTARFD